MSQGDDRGFRLWRWVILAGCLGLLAAVFLQSRTVSGLRAENEALRAQVQSVQGSATNFAPVPGNAGADAEHGQREERELLRLRNEVGELRQRLARAATGSAPAVAALAAAPPAAGALPDDDIGQLGGAARRGDLAALDKMAKLVVAARTVDTNNLATVLSGIRAAFVELGTEAGKGNDVALRAVWQATRVRELQGFAVNALGQAAGQGNQEALKPLLDPERYLILRSSAVAALKPAADAGNGQAIQALAAVAADPNQQALWLMAAQGLGSSAAAGNAVAIDALASLAAGENQAVNREAVLALEAAARNRQARAEEALRKLGWR